MNPLKYSSQKSKGQIKEELRDAALAANQFYRVACTCREMAKDLKGWRWFKLMPTKVKTVVHAIILATGVCNGKE